MLRLLIPTNYHFYSCQAATQEDDCRPQSCTKNLHVYIRGLGCDESKYSQDPPSWKGLHRNITHLSLVASLESQEAHNCYLL